MANLVSNDYRGPAYSYTFFFYPDGDRQLLTGAPARYYPISSERWWWILGPHPWNDESLLEDEEDTNTTGVKNMTANALWENDVPVCDIAPGIKIPDWIENREITAYNVASIIQGGCASGAYMPAVDHHKALATMSVYGDEVLNFIEERTGESPEALYPTSWSAMACFFLSYAVELWAASIEEDLLEAIEYDGGEN